MTFYSPGQVFLHIGSISIRYYGLMFFFLLGFICASFALKKLAARDKTDAEPLINCALICFLGGIFGARLYFVLLNLSYFLNHLTEIFAVWLGGLSIHGGIIGATLVGIYYAKKEHLPIWPTADLLVSVVPLAQSIGRWGNFFNCELFGSPVGEDFPFKQYIPPELRPPQYSAAAFFQPTFLYESIWDLVLFFLLYFVILPKFRKYPGITFCIYLIGYSLGRILIEPIRLDSIMFGSAKIPLIVSYVFLFIALLLLLILAKTKKYHFINGNKKQK